MSSNANSLRAILFALGANFSIFIAKSVAAFLTGSGAMLAEAIHSLADCCNQVLLLVGIKQSQRPATLDHPLGWGKVLYFWSFLVAVLLFSVGGMFSLYEGVHKLSHPEPIDGAWIAVVVLVFAIVVETISFRACLQEVNKVRRGRSLWQWFGSSRNSELLVIFGEDLAALVGLVLALLAVVATWITGNPLFDALGTLAIGALLIVIAVLIAKQVMELLVGQGIEQELEKEIVAFLEAQEGIDEVLNVITMQLGPDVMLAIKARMSPHDDPRALVVTINRLERTVKEEFQMVRWSFFEPDLWD